LPGWLLLDIGWMCVGLGFIGVFVPGLPTTIFLLVAAWCFFRSNERAHAWLLEHRLLGQGHRARLRGRGDDRGASRSHGARGTRRRARHRGRRRPRQL